MVTLPVLGRLDIEGYGLYPGAEGGDPGLHVEFRPGLTLVLGANGLGKSTLVHILYRLLTGPYDIPGLANRVDLGNVRLTATQLAPAMRSIFAQRVTDGARNARARLAFRLGAHDVLVERRLDTLALTQVSVDGAPLASATEEAFQQEILRLVGVWSFGDWVLLLRHLVFYFEDRRALVWDPSAQRQLLRILFFVPERAQRWAAAEREILEKDSRMRNLNAAVTREERALATTETRAESASAVREELQVLEQSQARDTERREVLESEQFEIDCARQHARQRLLAAEQEREARYRALERGRLAAISARFPTRSETARYIMAQLLTESECLVCGTQVPVAAARYQARVDHDDCVVCGTDLSRLGDPLAGEGGADELASATSALEASEREESAARAALSRADAEFTERIRELRRLEQAISVRSSRIDDIVRMLPPGEGDLHKQRAELASMRSRVEILKQELGELRVEFQAFVDGASRALVDRAPDIGKAFDEYAHGFLLEQCHLVWSPQKARLGESGAEVTGVPGFELEMTGTDFPSPVRRSGPEQVSESQREFIDLAFRMALMEVATVGEVGSLVIDAPESSLDAVFVGRAATVLARFAEPRRGNRLVVTSNLVEGQLIPDLVKKATEAGANDKPCVVDLLSIAAPTAAVRLLRDEYAAVRDRVLAPMRVS